MKYKTITINSIPFGEDTTTYLRDQVNNAKNFVNIEAGEFVKIVLTEGVYEIDKPIRIPTGVMLSGEEGGLLF